MRLSRSSLCALLVLGALAAACSRGDTAGQASQAPAASASAARAQGMIDAFLADKSQPLTPEIEEQLLLAVSSCKVDDNGIDRRCPAYRNAEQARNRKWKIEDPAAAGAAIGEKHLADESPAVRLRAARLMAGKVANTPPARKALIAAAQKEKVPGVLVAMLRVLGSRQHGDPGVGKLLLKSADHPSPRVRMEAMGWLLTPAGARIEGGFKKVSEKLDKDPSLQVRSYLCSRLYGSRDPAAMDAFKKYLTAEDTPAQLAGGCFRGLIGAWTGLPHPDKPLKDAYELTLKVLEKTPRSEHSPPFAAISSLRAARTDYAPADKGGTAWVDKVKGWYKQDRLIKALESLAGDLDAHWLARASAIDVMHALHAPKPAYKRVLSHYAKATGRDASLKRRIEALIKGDLVPRKTGKGPKGSMPAPPPMLPQKGAPKP